jgi:hypothetical protein
MIKDPENFAACTWYVGGIEKADTAVRYETTGVLGRFCVPSDKEMANAAL